MLPFSTPTALSVTATAATTLQAKNPTTPSRCNRALPHPGKWCPHGKSSPSFRNILVPRLKLLHNNFTTRKFNRLIFT